MHLGSARRRRLAAGALAIALIAAACADKKDADKQPAATTTTPATTVAVAPDDSTAPATTNLTSTQVAPSSAPPTTVAPRYGGTLRIAGEADVGSPWTPAAVQCDSYCYTRIRTVIEPLTTTDQDRQLQMLLAESVTPNADFSVWDITVRQGISFTDGTPLNADAVIYNLQDTWRGLLVSAAMRDVARVGSDPNAPLMIDKTGEFSLRVTLGKGGDPKQPISWPLFPYYLAAQPGFIASPTWLEAVKTGTAEATEMVGTGPFLLQEYSPGQSMTVTRNPDYWLTGGDGARLPYLDQIEFFVINDAKKREDALRTGAVDLIATSDASNINSLDGDDDYRAELFPEYGPTSYVMFHLTQPGLDDRRVRCALNQAVDKQGAIDTIYGGGLTPANGPFSPGQEGHLPDNGSLPYDPDAARALIAKYVAETGQQPRITYSTTTDSNNLLLAQYLQRAWEDVGVEVDIDQTEQSVYITNALIGSPDFWAFGWRGHNGQYVDEQSHWWSGSAGRPDREPSLNFGRLDDPVINDLLDQARSETDPDVRRGLAEQINREFAKECWILPMWFTRWALIHTTDVQGIGESPLPDGRGTFRDDNGSMWLQGVFLTD